jgi:hypothetical protein
MMPLLVIFQIPAASYIPRGWVFGDLFLRVGAHGDVHIRHGARAADGVFLDEEPAGSHADVVVCFNLSRGISVAPGEDNGPGARRVTGTVRARSGGAKFREFFTFLLAAACLAGESRSWQFAVLFGFSAVMGAVV